MSEQTDEDKCVEETIEELRVRVANHAWLRRVEAAAREALDQIDAIGIEDWHGAEGLDLSMLRDELRAKP